MALEIRQLAEAFENKDQEKIDELCGKIYAKLLLVLDSEIRITKNKFHLDISVNEGEIIDNAFCVLFRILYDGRIQKKYAYVLASLRFDYLKKVRTNIEPDNELIDDVYKLYKEYLELHEQGEIIISDKDRNNYIQAIRRIKRKAKLHKKGNNPGLSLSRLEKNYTDNIDREKVRNTFRNCVKKLSNNERKIFLYSLKYPSQRAIAEKCNVTEGRISQVLKISREKLSKCFSNQGIKKEDSLYGP